MSYTHFAHTQPVWIGRVGSTEATAARAAAKDLLKALSYSESKFTESYGAAVPPGLIARLTETRRRLSHIAAE
jgi:TolB protein